MQIPEVDVIEADDLPADAFCQRYVVRIGRAAVQRTAPCMARCHATCLHRISCIPEHYSVRGLHTERTMAG